MGSAWPGLVRRRLESGLRATIALLLQCSGREFLGNFSATTRVFCNDSQLGFVLSGKENLVGVQVRSETPYIGPMEDTIFWVSVYATPTFFIHVLSPHYDVLR